jgi:ABC-type transporter Mla MlaB component
MSLIAATELTAPLLLPAQLDHSQVAQSHWLSEAKQANWQLDARELQQFDSSVLALLLDLGRAAKADRATLQVSHATPKLVQLAKLYGVDALIF